MKPHPIDYFSLISGLAFASVATWLYSGADWAWPTGTISRLVAPSILLLIGFAILVPKKPTAAPALTAEETAAEAQAHDELFPTPLDD